MGEFLKKTKTFLKGGAPNYQYWTNPSLLPAPTLLHPFAIN